jgi:predicted hydrocarbon binding protein
LTSLSDSKNDTKKDGHRSVNITGPVTSSPISSGNFQGPVTYNYNMNNYGTQLQQQLFEKKAPEYKRPPKPNFSGLKIFVGRQQDIIKIKQYLTAESKNAPIAIVGEGGIGKTTLAFKAMHGCQDMFDIIIPVYFESVLAFKSFLLEMAKSLQLPMTIDEFEKFDNVIEEAQIIKDALARYGRVLIYADNYETIRNSISVINSGSTKQQSLQEEKENAIEINKFLKDVPENTCVLLTSRHRNNLAGEKTISLEGLSVQEGYGLFIEVAGDKLPKNISIEIKNVIQEISKNTGGHLLSIQILANTYGGDLLPELREMLEHLGAGDVSLEEEEKSRHKSLEACFEYSISKLPETHKLLYPSLCSCSNHHFQLQQLSTFLRMAVNQQEEQQQPHLFFATFVI